MCRRPSNHRRGRSWWFRAGRRTTRQPARPVAERSAPDEPSLAAEVEAFLHGGIAELRAAAERPIPPWMALNRLAHADVAEVRLVAQGQEAAATGRSPSPGYNYAWAAAERSLAVQMLDHGHDAEDIHRIQSEVLAPLELWLIERSKLGPFTAGQLIAEAVDALDGSHPSH